MSMEKQEKLTANRARGVYAVSTVVLLVIEVLIALFIHDSFVRPYIGDVLVVVVIYTFLRTLFPGGIRLLPVYIFLFAAGVEISQYFHIVELLGLGDIRFFQILIGSVFDIKDILCYLIGCILLEIYEIKLKIYL